MTRIVDIGNQIRKCTRQPWLVIPLGLLSLLASSSGAYGNLVTFEFGGTVTTVIGNTAEAASVGVALGVPIAGSLTFDDSAPDSTANTSRGTYNFSSGAESFQLSVGTLTLTSTDFEISVANDLGSDVFDVNINSAVSGGGFVFYVMRLVLIDSSETLFTDDSLPLVPPVLSIADNKIFNLWEEDGGFSSGEEWRMQATLTSLTAIPEPSALLCVGLVALGFAGWKQVRRKP